MNGAPDASQRIHVSGKGRRDILPLVLVELRKSSAHVPCRLRGESERDHHNQAGCLQKLRKSH